jgi:tetratricopeptide (TPR) repeat protein
MPRSLVAFALAVLALFSSLARAADRAVADCGQIADPSRAVSGCTLVLQRGLAVGAKNQALALTSRGFAYSNLGDLERAFADLNQAVALDPTNAFAYVSRSSAYLKKYDYDRALADSSQAVLLNRSLAAAYAARGFAYVGKANFDRAAAEFDQAILLDPRLALAYVGRAVANNGNSDFDKARADTDQALLLDPKLAAGYVIRSVANMGKGDYVRARADADQALAAAPSLALAHAARGADYFLEGDNSRALEEYNEAALLDAKDPTVHALRAEVEARQGQFDAAEADAEASLRIFPAQAGPHAFLSYVFAKKGDFNRASAEINEAFRFDPKSLAAVLYRGELHLMKGDAQAALEDFQSVLARSPLQLAIAGRDAAKKALAAQTTAAPAPQVASRADASNAPAPQAAAPPADKAPPLAVAIAPLGKRVALIVANSAYKGAPLGNPTIDADIVAASLTAIGFTVKVAKNADLGGFDSVVSAFAQDARGADVALFYFAGHGFTVNEGVRPVSVLMSTSADVSANSERVLRAGGIPLDDIVASLAGQAKATLIFVDACRNDPRLSRGIGGRGRGFDRLEPVEGGSLFVGLSTRLGETAQDGDEGKGSPFARAFAKTIETKGMRIDDAFRQLRDAVKVETSGKQIPDIVQDDLPNGAITLVNAASAQ